MINYMEEDMTLKELMNKLNPLLGTHGDEEVMLITKVPEEYVKVDPTGFHPHIVADVGSAYVDEAEGHIVISEVEGIAA